MWLSIPPEFDSNILSHYAVIKPLYIHETHFMNWAEMMSSQVQLNDIRLYRIWMTITSNFDSSVWDYNGVTKSIRRKSNHKQTKNKISHEIQSKFNQNSMQIFCWNSTATEWYFHLISTTKYFRSRPSELELIKN